MSTKSTIAYTGDWHIYEEALEYDTIYIDGPRSHARFPLLIWEEIRLQDKPPTKYCPEIPLHVWKSFRRHTITWTMEIYPKSEKQIRVIVEKLVDDRIAKHRKDDVLAPLYGFWIFGDVENPRDEQVKQGMAYYMGVKTRLRAVHNKIIQFTIDHVTKWG